METGKLAPRKGGAKHSGSRFAKPQRRTRSLSAFRAKVLREREVDTVGEALMLRAMPPEESLEIMFDMAEFVEGLAKAVEGT